MKRIILKRLSAITFTVAFLISVAAHAQTIEWIRQLGPGPRGTGGNGASADTLGNVFLTGSTSDELGETSSGGIDFFVSQFNSSGDLLWTRQLGTGGGAGESAAGVIADDRGNVYFLGDTRGNIGGPPAGDRDVFLGMYDRLGDLQWIRQFGTPDTDWPIGIVLDELGNVYVAGITAGELGGQSAGGFDAYLSKYNGDGDRLWIRQFGTDSTDTISSVSTDGSGNVFVAGGTRGDLAGQGMGRLDAFLRKYNSVGEHQWTTQFGTADTDVFNGVSADDSGNVYVAGGSSTFVNGDFVGLTDFIRKYDAAGDLIWSRDLEGDLVDNISDVATDGFGNVYISGNLGGDSTNFFNADVDLDIFVSKYDGQGNLLWKQPIGTPYGEIAWDLSVGELGDVYLSGTTYGNFADPAAGPAQSAFVIKLSDVVVPEPGGMVLALLAGVSVLRRRRRSVIYH